MEMGRLEIQIQKIAWNAMYNKFLRLLFQLIENIRWTEILIIKLDTYCIFPSYPKYVLLNMMNFTVHLYIQFFVVFNERHLSNSLCFYMIVFNKLNYYLKLRKVQQEDQWKVR